MRPNRLISAIAVCTCATGAIAQHGDIILDLDAGQIVLGFDYGSGLEFPAHAFPSEFVGNFTDEPGFDSEAGVFPPNSRIGFNIRKALRLWDGMDFSTIPDERIDITSGPLGPVRTPQQDELVPGFGISVSAGGEWHNHLGFELLPPADEGVYLLELELWSDAGIATSDPFWIVFNQNVADQEFDEAFQWVMDTLVGGCAADLDGDGDADVNDFFLYLDFFDAGDPRADITGDGSIDVNDFFMYLDLFEQGC